MKFLGKIGLKCTIVANHTFHVRWHDCSCLNNLLFFPRFLVETIGFLEQISYSMVDVDLLLKFLFEVVLNLILSCIGTKLVLLFHFILFESFFDCGALS